MKSWNLAGAAGAIVLASAGAARAYSYTATVGKLPGGATLRLKSGNLRAVEASGAVRWELSREDVGTPRDSSGLKLTDGYGNNVALSRNARLVAIASHDATRVQLREARTGKLLHTLNLFDRSAAWLPRSAGQRAMLPAEGIRINHLAFSPDSRRLAVGGADADAGQLGRARVFDVRSGRVVKSFESPSAWVYTVKWTSNSKVVAELGNGKKQLFSVASTSRRRRRGARQVLAIAACV